ncbi:MAG TPA: tRNA isopentenyl-2-thiomethyl-A-37 hydroxylase MiaE [bacterium]|nr:tRNA isopentenyl-2-thiomethyl-A-37 hydroxylase MiaE [bacterium]
MGNKKASPLKYQTPPEWSEQVLREPLVLLSDQAYLEKKAANNALEFLNLWPSAKAPAHWLSSISTIAGDETAHLKMVLRLLEKRGGTLERTHKNPYAVDLHQLVRRGKGKQDLADRLLVSALIEARSCERFERLVDGCKDVELSKFYAGLIKSENGHYRLFVDMAKKVLQAREVEKRWEDLLAEEAKIIQAQPPGPRIHSGVA